jgi:FecR protein
MNDDYLWDGSGEPDPEIQKLESTLGRFRHNRPAPDFRNLDQVTRTLPTPQRLRVSFVVAFACLATAAALAIVAVHYTNSSHRLSLSEPDWRVATQAGMPFIGKNGIGADGKSAPLRAGQTLETDRNSRASISDGATGEVEIDPDTRLRAVESRSGTKRLALDRGTIHAQIWAPAGRFVVDTPSAVAVDLGCVYTLHVDDSGDGLLQTSFGWVGFKLDGHESFIPTGAACATHPNSGPGTPYFEDSSAKFRGALARFDSAAATPVEKSAALTIILTEARKRDAFTVWHLLTRVEESDRLRVYDRLAALAPPPSEITRDGILRLDRSMLDLWWNQLGLGEIKLWRNWERNWPEASRAAK